MFFIINCFGRVIFMAIAVLFSKKKKCINWRSVGILFVLNIFVAWFLTQFSVGRQIVSAAAAGFV